MVSRDADAAGVADLLRPVPDRDLECWPVATKVNKVGNDGRDLVEPVEPGRKAAEIACPMPGLPTTFAADSSVWELGNRS